MNNIRQNPFFFGLLLYLLLPNDLFSEIKLPSILSDNMVLQQNTSVKIWGWADPQEKITVSASWLTKEASTLADKNGNWNVTLRTIDAGGPYSIVIAGKNRITLNNILLGEVWLCSGQSNMEMKLKMTGGWKNNPGDLEDFFSNDYIKVRLCDIRNDTNVSISGDCKAVWSLADTAAIDTFSAVAWFFGRELTKALKVPVALITSDWGGTPAEAWTAETALENDKSLTYFMARETKKTFPEHRCAALYNAMIRPVTNFVIKGVIWYQGEANIYDAGLYDILFPAMVKSWRDSWKIGDFPFYFVQIAPFDYRSGCNASAYLREAQTKSLDKIPNSGMIVTLDIGDVKDIHPVNKQEVGRRLSLLALKKTYNLKAEDYTVPTYRNAVIEKKSIRIRLTGCGSGLVLKEQPPAGFDISGGDLVFHPAKAMIEGNDVIVSSDSVEEPVFARYAFSDTAVAVLFNKEGFPASCFRTDTESLFYGKTTLEIVADTLTRRVYAILSGDDAKTRIRYTIDGSVPVYKSSLYEERIILDTSAVIRARIFAEKRPSAYIGTYTYKEHKGNMKKPRYITQPEEKYKGNHFTLTDGIHGSSDFREGNWQGFLGNDVVAQYDFPTVQPFSRLKVSFLQDMTSWIFAPLYVEVYTTDEKGSFILSGSQVCDADPHEKEAFIKEVTFDLGKTSTDHIRIVAKNRGLCPQWHPGAKEKAWVFIDEIELY